MISISAKDNFKQTRNRLAKFSRGDIFQNLDQYGKMGVDALAKATPVDTNLTASSWGYRIIRNKKRPGIVWYNTNVVNGTPVAILIQYGHATGTGGYVQGRDFINPAMRPVFDKIADDIWKRVTSG